MAEVMFGLNQVVELPQAGPQAANDAVAKNIPGMIIRYNGRLYRYVQFDDGSAVTAVAAGVLYWKSLNPAAGTFIATSDESAGLAGVNGVAGVLGGVVTDQYYTWIGVGGPHTVKVASGTIASDTMTGSATDLTLDPIHAGNSLPNNPFGIALDNRETTFGTATIMLQNLVW